MCIRVWDWSETSQTVSIFTKSHGVVRCVAKGAKRDNARFSGGLEVLTRGELSVSLKGGESLSILASWDLVEVFPAARRNLRSFHIGMLMLDVAARAVHDHDPHESVYDALVLAAQTLGEAERESEGLLGLLWAALVETGHRPELTNDVNTGEALAAVEMYGFSPHLGGLVKEGTPDDRGPVWRVRAETVALLRELAEAGALVGASSPARTAAVVRATRLLLMHYRETFSVDPPTFRKYLGEAGV